MGGDTLDWAAEAHTQKPACAGESITNFPSHEDTPPPAAGFFIKGLELNKGFYFEVVKPLLDKEYPNLPYSAALLGYGSDVLGFDTEISMDHNWGPRFQLFIGDNSLAGELLTRQLTK